METPTKTCTKCGNTYPLTADYFHRRNTKLGFASHCKTCRKERDKLYNKKPEVREAKRIYERLHYRKQHPPEVTSENPTKTCPRCKQTYPATLEYFHKNETLKYGVACWCKTCKQVKGKEYSKRPEVREHVRELERLRYAKNPDKYKAKCKKYHQAHAKELLEKHKARYKSNPEVRYRRKLYDLRLTERGYYKTPKYREQSRLRARDIAARLTDGYVKVQLTVNQENLTVKDIPQDLIELKRKQLKLYRDVKKKQHRQSQEKTDSHRRPSSNQV